MTLSIVEGGFGVRLPGRHPRDARKIRMQTLVLNLAYALRRVKVKEATARRQPEGSGNIKKERIPAENCVVA